MSATTFNYHFVPPPDLICQSQELPVYPKRTNEEADIKVTIKKDIDWPVITVIFLGIITTSAAIYAINNSIVSRSKLTHTANSPIKMSVSTTPMPSQVKEPTPINLEEINDEKLPPSETASISAEVPSKVETKLEVTPSNGNKSGSTDISPNATKATSRGTPKSSTTNAPNKHSMNVDTLPISPPSLREIERSTLPLSSPKFIVETEQTKVLKGGIFKRPARPETTEAIKATKQTQKTDTTPQTLF